jgi:threonine/homoserine/homoserine lactone efflux protein
MAPMANTRAINMLIFFTMMLLLNFIVLVLYFFPAPTASDVPKKERGTRLTKRFGGLRI